MDCNNSDKRNMEDVHTLVHTRVHTRDYCNKDSNVLDHSWLPGSGYNCENYTLYTVNTYTKTHDICCVFYKTNTFFVTVKLVLQMLQ